MLNSKYGRLTVLRFDRIYNNYRSYYVCKCDCGNIKSIRDDHLVSGASTSCGCYRDEVNSTGRTGLDHVVSNTQLRKVWAAMRQRCTNPKNISYANYGAKGIRVCDEWDNSYKTFHDWSHSNGYLKGLSIERIDVTKGYNPDNCRWVTRSENNKEMLDRHYKNGTGQFTKEVIENLTEKNRDNLGCDFEMLLDGKVVKVYRCLIECAEDIVKEKSLTTLPVQIKKNISACLNGKRKKCHGYTFRRK